MAFDENKYKKIFESRYGSGSFDSGLSQARDIGRLKVQADVAQKDYMKRYRAAQALAKAKKEAENIGAQDIVNAFTREQQDKENIQASNASLKATNPIKGAGTVGESYWASKGIPKGLGTTQPTPKAPANKWVNPYTRDDLKAALAAIKKAKDTTTQESYSNKFNSYASAGKDKGASISAYDKMQSFAKKIDPNNTPSGTTRFYDTLQTKGYKSAIEKRQEDFMMNPVVSKQHDKYAQEQKQKVNQSKNPQNNESFVNHVKDFFTGKTDIFGRPMGKTDTTQNKAGKVLPGEKPNGVDRFVARASDVLGTHEAMARATGDKKTLDAYYNSRKFGQGGGTDMLSTGLSYLAPTDVLYKGLTKLMGEQAVKTIGGKATRGALAGGALTGGQVGIDAALNPNSQNWNDNAKNILLGTALGGVGDPLLHGLGNVASTGLGKLAKGEVPTFTGKISPNVLEQLAPKNNPNKLQEFLNANRKAEQGPLAANPNQLPFKLGENNTIQPLKAGSSPSNSLLSGKGYTNIGAAPKSKIPGMLPPSELDNHGYGLFDTQAAAKSLPQNKFDAPYHPGDQLPDTSTHIGSKTVKDPLNIKAAADKGYIKVVDNLHRLSQFDNQVSKVLGHDLKPSQSTHTLGLNSRGSDMISKQILTQDMVNKNGEVVGNSLKNITMQVPKGKLKAFEDYLVNKHAITRMSRGEKVFPDQMNMTTGKSQEIIKNYEATHPEFKNIAKQYYEYNKNLGKHWLVDTGVLSKEQWDGYLKANPHYVPNNRIFSNLEMPKFGNSAKKGFANQSNPVKKAIGSQRQIVSPIESTIEHTAQYVKTAKRNEVMQTLINNIKQNPSAFKDWAEIVPTDKTPQSIIDTLQKEGVDGVLGELNKGFDQKPDLSKGNIVAGIIDGQKVHVKVNDPHLLDAITNLSPKAQNIVIHSLGQVTRVMKNLTTGINPVFSLTRNVFKDIPTAYINSKSTKNPLKFAYDLVDAFTSVASNPVAESKVIASKLPALSKLANSRADLYKQYRNVGGGHASPLSSDVNLLAQSKRSILPQKGLKPLLGKGLGALENLNNAIESAPRLGEFKRLNSNNYDSKMKALYAANDVTVNFNRYGNVAKEIDSVVPYFNAAIQGIDKTGRTFLNPKTAPAAIAKAFAAVSIPSIIDFAANHNNPDYQKLSNYIKDNNIVIPKGDGTFYKIPVPREVGTIFHSGVTRVLRAWVDHDPKAFEGFASNLLLNFLPPLRTIGAPFTDIRANKNFMGAPIVPNDLQGLSPRYQYDAQTSEPAKSIGNILNVSPKQIDYLTKSYGGVLGQLGIPATTKNGSIGQTLKQQVTADPVFANDIMSNFYKQKTQLDQAHADLTKQGINNPNSNESLRKMMDKQASQIAKIRKQTKIVQNDSSLTPQERLTRIRQLQDMMNQIASMTAR